MDFLEVDISMFLTMVSYEEHYVCIFHFDLYMYNILITESGSNFFIELLGVRTYF